MCALCSDSALNRRKKENVCQGKCGDRF
uniref:Uncharacterized protein n=1 Tax=Anguilla anguilla TaxID=7936 RepID=A0A0E9XQF7_ANGAN